MDMPERNKQGYLRAEQLRAGEIEQYAVARGIRYVEISLGWTPTSLDDDQQGYFWVHLVIRKGTRYGRLVEDRTLTYDDIDEARERFRNLMKAHP
jgi:hypothetical protein